MLALLQHLLCKFTRNLKPLCFSNLFTSLEAAAVNPDGLSQAAIIDNLDPVEAARLDKVRNIGIAVSAFISYLERIKLIFIRQ